MMSLPRWRRLVVPMTPYQPVLRSDPLMALRLATIVMSFAKGAVKAFLVMKMAVVAKSSRPRRAILQLLPLMRPAAVKVNQQLLLLAGCSTRASRLTS